jgi:hypothetical protein
LDKYDINDLIYNLPGDVNLNNQLTIHDVALITAYMQGDVYKRFSEQKADFNADGNIDLLDAGLVASEVMISDAPSVAYAYSTPLAAGELYGNDVVLSIGEDVIVPLNLMRYSGEDYTAMQFEIRVPDGVFINDIVPTDAFNSHNFAYEMLDMNTYRVVVYSDDNTLISGSDNVIVNLDANATSVIEEDARAIEILNAYAVDGNNEEVRFDDVKIAFSQSTGISGLYATYSVRGGDCITVTSLEPQEIVVYSVDGRLVRKVCVNAGTTKIPVPAGMYIVGNDKILVY